MTDPVYRKFQNYGDSAEITKILVDPAEPLSADNQLITRAHLLQVAGGDLKSDGSIQMVGDYSPELGQDIATKTSSEANFTDRILGHGTNGELLDFTGDLNTLEKYGEWRFLADGNVEHYPAILAGKYCTVENHYRSSTRHFQIVRATEGVSSYFYRSFDSGTWGTWTRSSDSANHQYDPTASGLTATNVQAAIDELAVDVGANTTALGGKTLSKQTEAQYAALVAAGTTEPATIYFIV